jgi:hypothetical protein
MFEYKFVRIDVSQGMFGQNVSADHREIIRQHAAEGWRLAHILGVGALTAGFELIFERPRADKKG